MIFAVLFYVAALLAAAAIIAGAWVHPRWYWVAAGLIYLDSFLSGFSIGLYLLSLAFVTTVLALSHSLGWIKRFWHSAAAVAIGMLLWWGAVSTIDDYWLFLPISWLP
ncbi:MAG: hypothetical protein K0R39_1761 [Symbiobacteriaceae bacterium]|jgi:hypothetical protein|nr:hypothetical protein [Symbiobacteriaceae bacterium]